MSFDIRPLLPILAAMRPRFSSICFVSCLAFVLLTGASLASAAELKPTIEFNGLPDRPEKIQFPPLTYEPPNQADYRVQLKSGPVAYIEIGRAHV